MKIYPESQPAKFADTAVTQNETERGRNTAHQKNTALGGAEQLLGCVMKSNGPWL